MQRGRIGALARPDRAAVPWLAGAVIVGVEEERAGGKIARRPDPEELAGLRRRALLRVARADGPNAPRAVARAEEAIDVHTLAIALDPAGVAAVLSEPRVVHHRSRAVAADEARLLDRERPALERHVRLQAFIRRVDLHPQPLQRLHHFDLDRANPQVHALHAE